MNELISNIIGIVEKAQQTSSDTGMILRVYACAISVLHEQWMYVGMQRHQHHTAFVH